MPTLSDIFDLPVPEGDDAPPHLPTVLQALVDRLEEVLAGGLRSVGVSKIAAAQAISSGAYVTAGTPDRVPGVVIPDEGDGRGLILVSFQALAKGDGYASIFVDGVEAYIANANTPPIPSYSFLVNTISGTRYGPLFVSPSGVVHDVGSSGADSTETTDPQILGSYEYSMAPFVPIEAPATDDAGVNVEIRYKANSGESVTVKSRRLRVFAFGAEYPPA